MFTARFRPGDTIFRTLAVGAGWGLLALLAAFLVFLLVQSLPALHAGGGGASVPGSAGGFWPSVLPLAFGSLWAAGLALAIAVPFAVGAALFVTHYVPRRFATMLGTVVDLLAAIPSVVYGLWGITVLAPFLQPLYVWLAANLGWIPVFAPPASGTGRTVLTVAVVLAVMVLPLMTAVCREAFLQTPRAEVEGALALGATRWESILLAVLPPARRGILAAVMLALGRALGETMAVAMVLSPAAVVSFVLVGSRNPDTIASNIALQFPEASGVGVSALIASGLVLFLITFLVNALARIVVRRGTRREAA